jgi:hypothetical protein
MINIEKRIGANVFSSFGWDVILQNTTTYKVHKKPLYVLFQIIIIECLIIDGVKNDIRELHTRE